ncbi:MAG TPA: c-type cytochrome [Dehalococcoidia bacterium]|nr:c-type cytochrome [Dehalococcoidia bacterium]
MNTSKQVNVMIGLLFLLVLSFGLYFVWDQNVRSSTAQDRQVEENAERGGKLFATNCRICHGTKGMGALENSNFPGLPLNLEGYRITEDGKLTSLRQRLTDTIKCGRIGTLMPPWSQDQGGPLTNTQIDQLVTLIVGSSSDGVSYDPNHVSELGWKEAELIAEEQDRLPLEGPPLVLIAAIGPNDTVLPVSDAHLGFSIDQFLRIGEEIVQVIEFPASSQLMRAVGAGDRVLHLQASSDFKQGVVVVVDGEAMRVVAVDPDASTITVERGINATAAVPHPRGATVQDPREELVVERGAFGTEAIEHAEGTQIFNGPLLPPTEPLTGEDGTPPCGQNPPAPAAEGAAPTPSPGQPSRPAGAQAIQGQFTEPANGVIETITRDNFFTVNNFKVRLNSQVTIRVINQGQQPHNLRVAGRDGQWNTGDDFAVPSDGSFLSGGQSGQASTTFNQTGTFVFRCDVHPTTMWGQITIE